MGLTVMSAEYLSKSLLIQKMPKIMTLKANLQVSFQVSVHQGQSTSAIAIQSYELKQICFNF